MGGIAVSHRSNLRFAGRGSSDWMVVGRSGYMTRNVSVSLSHFFFRLEFRRCWFRCGYISLLMVSCQFRKG